jgi:hypothetical protein
MRDDQSGVAKKDPETSGKIKSGRIFDPFVVPVRLLGYIDRTKTRPKGFEDDDN